MKQFLSQPSMEPWNAHDLRTLYSRLHRDGKSLHEKFNYTIEFLYRNHSMVSNWSALKCKTDPTHITLIT